MMHHNNKKKKRSHNSNKQSTSNMQRSSGSALRILFPDANGTPTTETADDFSTDESLYTTNETGVVSVVSRASNPWGRKNSRVSSNVPRVPSSVPRTLNNNNAPRFDDGASVMTNNTDAFINELRRSKTLKKQQSWESGSSESSTSDYEYDDEEDDDYEMEMGSVGMYSHKTDPSLAKFAPASSSKTRASKVSRQSKSGRDSIQKFRRCKLVLITVIALTLALTVGMIVLLLVGGGKDDSDRDNGERDGPLLNVPNDPTNVSEVVASVPTAEGPPTSTPAVENSTTSPLATSNVTVAATVVPILTSAPAVAATAVPTSAPVTPTSATTLSPTTKVTTTTPTLMTAVPASIPATEGCKDSTEPVLVVDSTNQTCAWLLEHEAAHRLFCETELIGTELCPVTCEKCT